MDGKFITIVQLKRKYLEPTEASKISREKYHVNLTIIEKPNMPMIKS